MPPIADGWSIGLLVSEFQAAARAIEAGASADGAAPELQVADYALWERELLASGALEESRQYWQRKLRGVAGTVVPADHEPTDRRGSHGDIVSLLLPPGLSEAVDDFASRHSFTLYGLAVAALALLLHRLTGKAKIVIGSQVRAPRGAGGRDAGGSDRQLDHRSACRWTARFLFSPSRGWRPTRCRKRCITSDCPSRWPPRPCRTAPASACTPSISSSIAPTRARCKPSAERGSFSLLSLPSFSSGTPWDLNFFLIWRDEGWRMSCEADGDLYDDATVKGLLEGWRDLPRGAGDLARPARWPTVRRCADIPTRAEDQGDRSAVDWASGRPDIASPFPCMIPRNRSCASTRTAARTPMIAINNRSVYYQLARAMGPDRPFIDIQTYHPDGPLDLSGYSFEDFATYAVRLIRSAQPNGPYLLGGHCVYGALAFEAARQLQRMGEKIELVCLFDTWAPGYRGTMSRKNQERRAAAASDARARSTASSSTAKARSA